MYLIRLDPSVSRMWSVCERRRPATARTTASSSRAPSALGTHDGNLVAGRTEGRATRKSGGLFKCPLCQRGKAGPARGGVRKWGRFPVAGVRAPGRSKKMERASASFSPSPTTLPPPPPHPPPKTSLKMVASSVLGYPRIGASPLLSRRSARRRAGPAPAGGAFSPRFLPQPPNVGWVKRDPSTRRKTDSLSLLLYLALPLLCCPTRSQP